MPAVGKQNLAGLVNLGIQVPEMVQHVAALGIRDLAVDIGRRDRDTGIEFHAVGFLAEFDAVEAAHEIQGANSRGAFPRP